MTFCCISHVIWLFYGAQPDAATNELLKQYYPSPGRSTACQQVAPVRGVSILNAATPLLYEAHAAGWNEVVILSRTAVTALHFAAKSPTLDNQLYLTYQLFPLTSHALLLQQLSHNSTVWPKILKSKQHQLQLLPHFKQEAKLLLTLSHGGETTPSLCCTCEGFCVQSCIQA